MEEEKKKKKMLASLLKTFVRSRKGSRDANKSTFIMFCPLEKECFVFLFFLSSIEHTTKIILLYIIQYLPMMSGTMCLYII